MAVPPALDADALVARNRHIEEATLRALDALEQLPGIDRRWLAIGRTHIEQGWMAINRAILKPARARFPGDDTVTGSPPPPPTRPT